MNEQERKKKELIESSIAETINVATLMELLSQYDGRFPICHIDKKGNMIPIKKKDINMSKISILLSNHVYIKDVSAIVIGS